MTPREDADRSGGILLIFEIVGGPEPDRTSDVILWRDQGETCSLSAKGRKSGGEKTIEVGSVVERERATKLGHYRANVANPKRRVSPS